MELEYLGWWDIYEAWATSLHGHQMIDFALAGFVRVKEIEKYTGKSLPPLHRIQIRTFKLIEAVKQSRSVPEDQRENFVDYFMSTFSDPPRQLVE